MIKIVMLVATLIAATVASAGNGSGVFRDAGPTSGSDRTRSSGK
jgi:hypothetical protein